MKYFRNLAAITAAAGVVLMVRAELPPGSADVTRASALESALYRVMGLPDGTVTHSRPPWEAQKHIGELIAKSPRDASLLILRAREEELLQNYEAAEADWRGAASANTADPIGAREELVSFYERRLRPKDELAALLEVAAVPDTKWQQSQPAAKLAQWHAFEKALRVIDSAQTGDRAAVYSAWIARFPKEPQPYQLYLAWQVKNKDLAGAKRTAEQLRVAFRSNEVLAINTQVQLARLRGGEKSVLAVFARSFSPLWPKALRHEYFEELSGQHQLRAFLTAAEHDSANQTTAFAAAGRLFFYYEEQGRKDVAVQRLLALEQASAAGKVPLKPEELKVLALLYQRAEAYDDSAHAWYSLYANASGSRSDHELALASLIDLLLNFPEQRLAIGRRDLSLYRNIATLDRHPGFLNGILSVALSGTYPAQDYEAASQSSVPYFHRASAALLIGKMRQEFPSSRRTGDLEAKLFQAYSAYGQNDAISRSVPAWMERNRGSKLYVDTALLLAVAYENTHNTTAEFALYEKLLTELGDEGGHMPVESSAGSDYGRVLDRYLSRLTQSNHLMSAVAVLRKEIDRNPDDYGLYERLALFLEQNRLEDELENTYKQAIAKFHGQIWPDKLARFYLRQHRASDYAALARQITDTFKGSEVAAFLTAERPTSETLYVEVNRYAHERFPGNLTFVHNLLHAYATGDTRDDAAYDALLREFWFYDHELRTAYFERLSQSGKLRQELAGLPDIQKSTTDSNLAALQMRAYGYAWLTEYETAAPAFARVAELVPGDRDGTDHAIAIERSLAAFDSRAFDQAIRFAQQDVRSAPGDAAAVTRVGEIYADRDMYAQAKPWWDLVAQLRPGDGTGYLDSASVFWDYFQYGDALRQIDNARAALHDPAKFAYEAGAIHENQGDYAAAVHEYVEGALHGASGQARERLLTLSVRKQTAALVDSEVTQVALNATSTLALELEVAAYDRQRKRSQMEQVLASAVPHARTVAQLQAIEHEASNRGLEAVAAIALTRIVAITADPIEKLQAQIALGRFYEAQHQESNAERAFAEALNADPNSLGVLRAAVDYYWRAKQERKAIDILVDAAGRAQPPYHSALLREAAQKAADCGDYARSRTLLDDLLKADPWNGDLLAAKADTYARQQDNTALAAFYADELAAFKQAPFSGQERTERVAALRRGYLQALIACGNFADALEQYQLLVDAYPEDTGLIAEVSRFAENHNLEDQVVAYYSKAVHDAPKDYRWPIVLARIETNLRRYPEAIAAYNTAAHVRPDRRDIFESKADLEVRLLRFQEAVQSYQKLYELSLHDSQYLADQAMLYERLGNKPQALKLLRAAYIEPHPQDPGGFLMVMRQESQWGDFETVTELFSEARPVLGKNWAMVEAVQLDAKALAALHRPQDALDIASSALPTRGAVGEVQTTIGAAFRSYLTPEEKAQLAAYLRTGNVPPVFNRQALADESGLEDVAADLLYDSALQSEDSESRERLRDLQARRLQYDELGRQLEKIAAAHQNERGEYTTTLVEAASAYQSAGDADGAQRLGEYDRENFAELIANSPGDLNARLQALARRDPARADAVLQYVIRNRPESVAQSAIAARGARRGQLWTNSYQALAGLYLSSEQPAVTHCFQIVLGPRTVGAEIGDASPRNSLRHAEWFYYASRFGEYLGLRRSGEADDFIDAAVEENGAASDNYTQLGDSFADIHDVERARAAYNNALQLSPNRADVYDRLAVLAAKAKNITEADELWRKALDLMAERVEQGPLPESYWGTARDVFKHINYYQRNAQLAGAENEMLRSYAKRNAAYRFSELLEGIFLDTRDTNASVKQLVAVVRMPEAADALPDLVNAAWVPESEKEPLYVMQIAHERKEIAAADPDARQWKIAQLHETENNFVSYLEGQKRWADAWGRIQAMEPADRPIQDLLESGAMTGHLQQLLEAYRAKPDSAPTADVALAAAVRLSRNENHDSALALREFEYSRELQAGSAQATAWFGLAEVRLEQNRRDEALHLIRDVTLLGEPFSNLSEAVQFLEKHGLADQAKAYALEWRTAEPWNSSSRLAYARLAGDIAALTSLVDEKTAPYPDRVAAALELRKLGTVAPGNAEPALLSHKVIPPEAAAQPYAMDARMIAAGDASMKDKVRLYAEVVAIDPEKEDARIDLAQAALATGDTYLALAAFDSANLFSEYGYDAGVTRVQSAEQRFAALFLEAARANAQRHNLGRAVQICERVGTPEGKADLAKYQKELGLEQANDARSPVVSESVGQPLIVKPKLAALEGDEE